LDVLLFLDSDPFFLEVKEYKDIVALRVALVVIDLYGVWYFFDPLRQLFKGKVLKGSSFAPKLLFPLL
jgi:hypothetical protein